MQHFPGVVEHQDALTLPGFGYSDSYPSKLPHQDA